MKFFSSMKYISLIYQGLFLLLTFSGPGAWANIRLPALLSDNMVLQQQSEIVLWGKADPGEEVEIFAGWSPSVRIIGPGKRQEKIKKHFIFCLLSLRACLNFAFKSEKNQF